MESYILQIVILGLFAFGIAMLITPYYIYILRHFRIAKQIRTEASMGGGHATRYHALHIHKQGTPNMGGVMILIVLGLVVIITILAKYYQEYFDINIRFSLWERAETFLPLFAIFSMGILGAIDDYLNVRNIGGKKGMSARVKMGGITLFAFLGAWWFFYKLGYDTISLPLFGQIHIGGWYIFVCIFLITAMANSVNITDGLDGLAGGLLVQNYFLYAFITFHEGLFLLSTLCIVIAAALTAFLWFNIKPAKFYLGDSGALALGSGLAVMALMTDTLPILFIISGVYLWEILSVMLQIASKKLRHGKKIFLIAPFHHHLEAKGMSEETIVMKSWLIGAILSTLGIIAYLLPPLF
ncbi:MAG: hypothetical protein WC753_00065 [Candidatus Gracilibacteria bacterium]